MLLPMAITMPTPPFDATFARVTPSCEFQQKAKQGICMRAARGQALLHARIGSPLSGATLPAMAFVVELLVLDLLHRFFIARNLFPSAQYNEATGLAPNEAEADEAE